MDEIIQILARLASLLEQYDNTEQGIANLEMQTEGFSRMSVGIGGEFSSDAASAKSAIAKALRLVLLQKDAFKRSIEELTGLTPTDLRDRLSDIRLALERAGEYTIEEKKVRGAFELLVEGNAFGEEPGETREDFEERLSNLTRMKEIAMQQLRKVTKSAIRQSVIVGITDSALSRFNLDDTAQTLIQP